MGTNGLREYHLLQHPMFKSLRLSVVEAARRSGLILVVVRMSQGFRLSEMDARQSDSLRRLERILKGRIVGPCRRGDASSVDECAHMPPTLCGHNHPRSGNTLLGALPAAGSARGLQEGAARRRVYLNPAHHVASRGLVRDLPYAPLDRACRVANPRCP